MVKPVTSTDTTAEIKASADRAADAVAGGVSDGLGAVTKTAKDGYNAIGNFFTSTYNSFKEKGFVGGVSDMFSGLWNMVSGLFGENGLNVGSLSGSGIGGFLGWSLGSFVGGGYLGTLISVAGAACGIVIGAQAGDKYINGFLGRPSRGTASSPSTSESPSQQLAMANPQTAIGANVPAGTTPIDFSVIDQHLAQVRAQYANGQVTSAQTAQVAYLAPVDQANAQFSGQRPPGFRGIN